MPASRVQPPSARVQLGSPVVPINPSGRYLRHRAAAERASRARCRATRWRRLLLALGCALLYFAIGRDLIALALAKKGETAMEVGHDVQTLRKDVERIAAASRVQGASENISPLAFTSAATLARTGDPSDIDAWLSDEPIDVRSRTQQPQSP